MTWEYMTVLVDGRGGWLGGKFDVQGLTDRLNALGRDHWELVTAFDTNMLHGETRNIVFALKRPMASA